MTKMTTKVKTQKSEKAWFFLGALAVFFMGVPYLVLGKDSLCSCITISWTVR